MAWDGLAEGEELGSNLLHVAQSSPGDPGGSGSLKIGTATGALRSDPEDGGTAPTACRAAGLPAEPVNPGGPLPAAPTGLTRGLGIGIRLP